MTAIESIVIKALQQANIARGSCRRTKIPTVIDKLIRQKKISED